MYRVYLKTKIHSGRNSLQVLSAYRNQKILLVCDDFLIQNGAVRQLLNAVDNSCEVRLFSDVQPDPPVTVVAKGVAVFRRFAPNLVIALGGGSAIDTAKGILYFAKQMSYSQSVRLIAVPTTSGTGSEVTSVTVLTEPETKIKHMIQEECIVPEEAILDASLTLSVPPEVTANTGMDVLTHALEAYVATGANPFTDAMAEKAVEFIQSSLLCCYQNGNDFLAREQMHEASAFAGIAFDQAGLGLSHSLAHQIGARFHIPHGLANTLVLREVILANCAEPSVCRKYAKLARAIGIGAGRKDDKAAVMALAEYVTDLSGAMHMAKTLRECGVSDCEMKASLEEVAHHVIRDRCMLSNPTKITQEQVKEILKVVY